MAQRSLHAFFGGKQTTIKKNDSKREGDRIYDNTKRKRSFQESWRLKRPWLMFDEAACLM